MSTWSSQWQDFVTDVELRSMLKSMHNITAKAAQQHVRRSVSGALAPRDGNAWQSEQKRTPT